MRDTALMEGQCIGLECRVVGYRLDAREHRNVAPSVPVDGPAVSEQCIKPTGIKRDVVTCMEKKLTEILALLCDKPGPGPELALQQLIVKRSELLCRIHRPGPGGSHSFTYSTVLPARDDSS
jgi:hypothetical protein